MKNNSAFTLIEILIVMVIIGFMMTIISPWLFKRKPEQSWPALLDRFNSFVFFARQEAISTNKNYRIVFKSSKKELDLILVEEETYDPEKPNQKIYKRVFSDYFETKYVLPEAFKMVAFYKGKVEQFAENKGNGICFVIPDGLVEDIIIHLVRKIEDKEDKATLKMSSFIGKFDFYEGFLKPEK